MPIFMTLILLLAQFALAAHAKFVVSSAAHDGAVAASRRGSSPEVGKQAALALLAGSGTTLTDYNAEPIPNGDSVTMTTWGKVVSVLPLVPEITVRASSDAVFEEWRP